MTAPAPNQFAIAKNLQQAGIKEPHAQAMVQAINDMNGINTELLEKVDGLQLQFTSLQSDVASLRSDVAGLSTRFDDFRDHMAAQNAALQQHTDSQVAALRQHTDSLTGTLRADMRAEVEKAKNQHKNSLMWATGSVITSIGIAVTILIFFAN